MLAKMFGNRAHWAPLLLRIGVGLAFFFSGLQKLTGIAGTVGFFSSLGLPVPGVTAPMIGIIECFGGLALLLGIGTRLAGLLLICDMVVAILVARLPGAQGLLAQGLPGGWGAVRLELILLLGALSLVLTGPGATSIEMAVLKREIP